MLCVAHPQSWSVPPARLLACPQAPLVDYGLIQIFNPRLMAQLQTVRLDQARPSAPSFPSRKRVPS